MLGFPRMRWSDVLGRCATPVDGDESAQQTPAYAADFHIDRDIISRSDTLHGLRKTKVSLRTKAHRLYGWGAGKPQMPRDGTGANAGLA